MINATKSIAILFKATKHVEAYLTKDIVKHALNPTEFGVLEILLNKGSLTIQEIGDRILMPNSSLTYVIETLIAKKMVIKEQSKKDKRAFNINLTRNGKKLIEEVFKKHQLSINKLFDVLNEQEINEMSGLLLKVGKHAQELRGK